MSASPPSSASRTIGLPSAISLIVANMIGAGVFTTTGFLINDLRSPWAVLAVWFLGGVQAMLGALCYSALARQIPESGGEYLFLSKTLHPALGYLAGWISLLVGFSAPVAAAAFAFGEYAQRWVGFAPQITGTALILLFAVVHSFDVRRGAWVQNWTVLVKLALIFLFVGLAVTRVDWTGVAPESTGSMTAFGLSLMWVSFSYAGWNAAVYIGGEVKNPERNLPRALIAGTALVMLLYLLLNFVFVFAAPVEAIAGQIQVARIAAEHVGGSNLARVVAVLISLALISSVSSMIMAGPRVYSRMAHDGNLPKWLAVKAGPPRSAIALQAVIALSMLWTASFEALLTYIGFTLSLSTAATVIGLMVLRFRQGSTLRVPGWPYVPTIFAVSVFSIAIASAIRRPVVSLMVLLTLAAGLLAWKLQSTLQRNSRIENPKRF